MLRQKLVPLLIACTLVIPLTVMMAGTAAASCNRGADSNYYWAASSLTPGGPVGGVSSYIYNYNPYVQSGGFSYAWVMLAGGPGSNWAQIGNYKSYNSRNIVIQVNNTIDGRMNVDFPAKAAGTSSTYTITFGSNHAFNFYVDGGGYYFEPRPWDPNYASWAAEIWRLSSQMMGDVNNHEFVSHNQLFYNGSWQANWVNPWLSTTGSGDLSTYFGLSGSAYSFQTWDKTCTS